MEVKLKKYLDDQARSSTRTTALKTEIAALRREISEQSGELADLDLALRPVWDTEAQLKRRIADTHGGRHFDFDGAAQRQPLFAHLLQLSIDWGKVRGERTRVSRLIKAYEREAQRLAKEVQWLEKRREKISDQAED
jgi:cell division protein FtsL